MQLFYVMVTLSSLVAPPVTFMTYGLHFEDYRACEKALPRVEGAVQHLLNYDPRTLGFFGTVIGRLTYGHHVQSARCIDGSIP